MRYARIDLHGEERVGVLTAVEPADGASAERVVATAYATGSVRLLPVGTDLVAAAVARQEPAAGSPSVPLTAARLLSPVRPASFRDFVSFEQHVQGPRR